MASDICQRSAAKHLVRETRPVANKRGQRFLGIVARIAINRTGLRRLIRASYYTAVNEHEEFQPLRPLVDWMQYNGWNTVTKPTREFITDEGQRKIKGNMNVELTVDAIALAPHIDHVVLFSGDQNFLPLVRHLQTTGIRVSVVSSIKTNPQMVADDLRRQADAFIELDSLRDSIGRPQNVASAA